MLPPDRMVAFAGRLFQTFDVVDFDQSPTVADDPGSLQRIGDDRDRVAPRADHLRQHFLGQRQAFAVAQIARAQQPARYARFDRVGGVACGGLLGLSEQRLLMPRKQGSKSGAAVCGRLNVGNVKNGSFTWQQDHRVGQ